MPFLGIITENDYYFFSISSQTIFINIILRFLFWDCYVAFLVLLCCFFGIITVPGFLFGIITLLFWDYYFTLILVWDCYVAILGLLLYMDSCLGLLLPPSFVLGLLLPPYFRDYYYPPILGIIPPPRQYPRVTSVRSEA
jgi:hypothetical protein